MRAMMDTLEQQVDPRHTAVLIVDMQKDFCTPGFGAERAGRDLGAANRAIPHISRLLAGARASGAVVAHVGFWTLPDSGSDSDTWLWKRRGATVSSPTLCIADSEGARFIDELAPVPGELQIRKHRYSAFTATNLDLLLRAHDVRTIIVTGVSTNVCVETTFRAGFELGYAVVVPPETCASWDQDLHEAALSNVRHRFGVTPPLDDILRIWKTDD
jgi:ureidoacrylate peracid hydrolase